MFSSVGGLLLGLVAVLFGPGMGMLGTDEVILGIGVVLVNVIEVLLVVGGVLIGGVEVLQVPGAIILIQFKCLATGSNPEIPFSHRLVP